MNTTYKPIHLAVAAVVFVTGLLNILTALALHHIPHIRLFEGLLPVFFLHTARTFTLLSGILLVNLSFNLSLRKKRAWAIATGVVVFSVFMHIIRGFNVPEIAFLLILLTILVFTRHIFEVESDKSNLPSAFARFIIVLLFLFVYAFFGFFLFQGQFSHPVTVPNIISDYGYSISGIGQEVLAPLTRNARWFANSISIVSTVSVIYAFLALFHPLIEPDKITADEKRKIRDLVLEEGRNSVSYFTLMNDKKYFFRESRNAVLSYVVKNGMAVVLGEPVAIRKEDVRELVEEFVHHNKKMSLKTVFYNTLPDSIPLFSSLGFKAIKIGEEAVIPISQFTLTGSHIADIRHAYNKVKREDIVFEWYRMDELPWRYVDAIEKLHEDWIALKKSPLLTFSLDYFPFPIENNAYVLTATGRDQTLLAAFSFFPYETGGAMSLDFMIRSSGAPNGIIETGIVEAVAYFKSLGIHTLSLGTAPLADVTPESEQRMPDKIRNLIFDKFNQFYQYKSLFAFKNKFSPVWVHKYLVYQDGLNLASALLAVTQAHLREPLSLLSIFQ